MATQRQAAAPCGAAPAAGLPCGQASGGSASGESSAGTVWLAAGLLGLPFVLWALQRSLTLDFWYDEVFTLDTFVFVPLSRTVTDYSHPNNHIFFNLLNNLYVRCVGLHDTFAAMDSPWLLRVPPLLYALGTLAVTFQTARRCCGQWPAYLSVIVLATTVPFFNFAAQVRGYSLSMLLMAAMVWFLFRWEEARGGGRAAAVCVAGALALYTIPSNLYFLLSVGLFYAAAAVGGAVRASWSVGGTQGLWRRQVSRDLIAAMLMAGAVAGAATLYLPVLGQLGSNGYVQGGQAIGIDTLTTLMPQMLLYLVSGRHLLAALVAGAAVCMARQRGWGEPLLRRRYLFCLAVLVLPFVWSSLRGDRPPDRVFVSIAPVFALLVGISARIVASVLSRRRGVAFWGLIVTLTYCYVTFAVSLGNIDRHLLADIAQGEKSQDAFYAYYQSYYGPLQVTKALAEQFGAAPGPVYVYKYGDQVALYRYLQKAGVPCFTIGEIQEIEPGPEGVAYVVTAWPKVVHERIAQSLPKIDCQMLGEAGAFQGVLVCRCNPLGG